jgi:hypothetical protein
MPYRSDATLLRNAFFSPGNTRASSTSTNHSKRTAATTTPPAESSTAQSCSSACQLRPKAAVPLGIRDAVCRPPPVCVVVACDFSSFGRPRPPFPSLPVFFWKPLFSSGRMALQPPTLRMSFVTRSPPSPVREGCSEEKIQPWELQETSRRIFLLQSKS